MNKKTGTLFIVATPIGNLGDMVPRAVDVLQSVDIIAAEDTRRAAQLCRAFNIDTPTQAYHDHNERAKSEKLIELLSQGKHVALISDAGMPLISDPGFRVVRLAREQGAQVTVVPGPCAAIVALAGSGLPSDKFLFLGFPPTKTTARQKLFDEFSSHAETLLFYESSHRILASLTDLVVAFGAARQICVARELTKKYETWIAGTAHEVLATIETDPNQQKGEFVVIVGGASEQKSVLDKEVSAYMTTLMRELPIKKAAAIAAQLLGARKKDCYEVGLSLQR